MSGMVGLGMAGSSARIRKSPAFMYSIFDCSRTKNPTSVLRASWSSRSSLSCSAASAAFRSVMSEKIPATRRITPSSSVIGETRSEAQRSVPSGLMNRNSCWTRTVVTVPVKTVATRARSSRWTRDSESAGVRRGAVGVEAKDPEVGRVQVQKLRRVDDPQDESGVDIVRQFPESFLQLGDQPIVRRCRPVVRCGVPVGPSRFPSAGPRDPVRQRRTAIQPGLTAFDRCLVTVTHCPSPVRGRVFPAQRGQPTRLGCLARSSCPPRRGHEIRCLRSRSSRASASTSRRRLSKSRSSALRSRWSPSMSRCSPTTSR